MSNSEPLESISQVILLRLQGHACGGQMCTTGVRGDMSVQNATSNPQNRHQSLRPPALEPLRIPAAVAPDGKRLSELSLAQQRRSLLVTTSGLQVSFRLFLHVPSSCQRCNAEQFRS